MTIVDMGDWMTRCLSSKLEVLSTWMRDIIRDGKNNVESTLKVFLFFREKRRRADHKL
jgi:hypothetical protein